MTETLRLVRVFLASPGDLPDERRLVKETEEELNSGIASHLGFRVELKGWEDTLSGSGRPQSIINQELDLCELFIGMMSRKWGTPPSADGPYSSGFQEEFERSSLRREKTGKPEMAMYFKEVDPKFLVDPGEDLKKVLAFKDRIASERSILYENFDEPHELQKRVRQKIQKYLIDLQAAEEESQEEEQAKTKKPAEELGNVQGEGSEKSPFSAEGYSFLKGFVEKTESEDSTEKITSLEVARFRLLSSAISRSGNDEPFLGVHDANIIYLNKQMTLGSREISRLVDCGLKNIGHENVPIWYWYNLYTERVGEDFLPYKSLTVQDANVGALKAMTLIGSPLPIENEPIEIDRHFFIEDWLSENASDSLKLAALRYLKHHGKDEDLILLQSELERADSTTARAALEAIVSIQARYNKSEALKTTFANQFESFDEVILQEVLSVASYLEDGILKLGLKHRNKNVRLESFKRLRERNQLNADDLQELKNDSFSLVRKEVIEFLLPNNQALSDEEVKNILIKPKRTGGLGFLALAASDVEGQACFDEYLFSKYSNMSKNELSDMVKACSIFEDIPYFALCSSYFKFYSEELRKHVDDHFKSKFDGYIEHIENMGISEENVEKVRSLEDSFRKQLTRKALDLLCEKGDAKDLDRIRKNMRSGYVKSSESEIEYMRKSGEWEDIAFVVKAERDYSSFRASLTISSIRDDWSQALAAAIYSIGKDRLAELLEKEIPPHILVELIRICSLSKFSEIPDVVLLTLLNSREEEVRKMTSIKSIQSFKKTKLKSLLEKYLQGQEYRYYNVIYWLDFGVSMPKSITTKAIRLISDE